MTEMIIGLDPLKTFEHNRGVGPRRDTARGVPVRRCAE